MERKIEFRGKRIEDGKWIYGYYWYVEEHYANPIENKTHFIKSKNNGIDYKIDIETLGQYTGLKDKHENKIYEGDIILSQEFRNKPFSKNYKSKRLIGVVEYYERKHNAGKQVYESGYKVRFIKDDEKSFYNCGSWSDFYDCEILGNIYDNKDLLN